MTLLYFFSGSKAFRASKILSEPLSCFLLVKTALPPSFLIKSTISSLSVATKIGIFDFFTDLKT